MSKKGKTEIPKWAKTGHAAPTTRREFLAHGLIPFVASATMPTWFQSMLGGSKAFAAETLNCPPSGHNLTPFISLNLAGGAAMSANYVPMDSVGSPLPSYSKMGLGDGLVPLEREFGNVPFAGVSDGIMLSKFLEGMRSVAQRSTLDKTAFIAFCVRSRDDTKENRFDISGLVYRAGVVGAKLPNLGSQNTKSGNSQTSAVHAPPSPLVVGNLKDLTNSLQYISSLGALNAAQKNRFAKLVSDLNSEQARKLASNPEEVKVLLDCAGLKNQDLIRTGPSGVNPAENAQIAALWGMQSTTTSGESFVFSAMVYNALMGTAGTVSLNKGGYDYHDDTRTTGNTMDLQAGVVMGRILETAAILNKKVCLYVTSDGAVVSENSADRQSKWTSDRGTAGVSYMLMFDPAGRRETTGFQVGSFTKDQAADEKFVIGNNPELAAQAVFANYLKLIGQLGKFETILGLRGLSAADVEKVLRVT